MRSFRFERHVKNGLLISQFFENYIFLFLEFPGDLKCVHQNMGIDKMPKKTRIAIHRNF